MVGVRAWVAPSSAGLRAVPKDLAAWAVTYTPISTPTRVNNRNIEGHVMFLGLWWEGDVMVPYGSSADPHVALGDPPIGSVSGELKVAGFAVWVFRTKREAWISSFRATTPTPRATSLTPTRAEVRRLAGPSYLARWGCALRALPLPGHPYPQEDLEQKPSLLWCLSPDLLRRPWNPRRRGL